VREPHELPGAPLRHPVEHLTDNYRKDEDSNNFKLLELDHRENQEICDALRLIEAWRDMDNACGFTLDKIGKNVLELRQGRDDPEYRKAIKIKIRGNLSAGTIEDLNAICDILFGESFVTIGETWFQALYDYEPAALSLILQNPPLDQMEFIQSAKAFINDIVRAGGVRLFHQLRRDFETEDAAINVAGITKLTIYHKSIPIDRHCSVRFDLGFNMISAGIVKTMVNHSGTAVKQS